MRYDKDYDYFVEDGRILKVKKIEAIDTDIGIPKVKSITAPVRSVGKSECFDVFALIKERDSLFSENRRLRVVNASLLEKVKVKNKLLRRWMRK